MAVSGVTAMEKGVTMSEGWGAAGPLPGRAPLACICFICNTDTFYLEEKTSNEFCCLQKGEKAVETCGRRPSLVGAGLQRPGALSQFLSHRSKRESGVSEHASDLPRSMFSCLLAS